MSGQIEERYPKDYMKFKEVYGYGGVRIYEVSKEQADQIVKEFPEVFKYEPPYRQPDDGEQLYYMNVTHGEKHVIFHIYKKPGTGGRR